MSRTHLYAAYGSNLHFSHMTGRCPSAELAGDSEISGSELLFRGDSRGIYATVEPLAHSSVPVRLWKITREDERSLDEYERYPELYRKEFMELDLAGDLVNAMVYVMNDGYELGAPSEAYLRTIEDGYPVAGVSTDFLARAVAKSIRLAQER